MRVVQGLDSLQPSRIYTVWEVLRPERRAKQRAESGHQKTSANDVEASLKSINNCFGAWQVIADLSEGRLISDRVISDYYIVTWWCGVWLWEGKLEWQIKIETHVLLGRRLNIWHSESPLLLTVYSRVIRLRPAGLQQNLSLEGKRSKWNVETDSDSWPETCNTFLSADIRVLQLLWPSEGTSHIHVRCSLIPYHVI